MLALRDMGPAGAKFPILSRGRFSGVRGTPDRPIRGCQSKKCPLERGVRRTTRGRAAPEPYLWGELGRNRTSVR